MLSLQRNWYWFSRAAAAPVVAFRRVGADHRLVGVDRRLGAPEQALAVEVRAGVAGVVKGGVAEVALAKVGMGPELVVVGAESMVSRSATTGKSHSRDHSLKTIRIGGKVLRYTHICTTRTFSRAS
jgi:hypothetical protein